MSCSDSLYHCITYIEAVEPALIAWVVPGINVSCLVLVHLFTPHISIYNYIAIVQFWDFTCLRTMCRVVF